MAASTQRTVRTPDGRTLAIDEAGDLGGRPVLVHNGTPNSRTLYGPAAADAAARGLRLIGYDRPGYGGSTPQPGRTVVDCAADVRAICAGLGIDRRAMWGVSGGGPHVLACQGWWEDGVAHAGRWGFELSDIRIPVLLMHGRQDQFVPFGHGQWLAARIPGVDARLQDDDGHLRLETNRLGEVHAWLADRL